MKYYLAIDIGASSGRHIIGYENNGKVDAVEIYRFNNGVKEVDSHLIWDIDNLLKEVINGIKIAIDKYKNIESLAIDTWGVDYVLLDGDNEIYPCYSYRDNRTKEAIKKVHNIIPFNKLYELTGTQFQPFNTIYQLYCDKEDGRLNKATNFLMIPEYLNYKLTGIIKKEFTNASTTGMTDAKTLRFSSYIIEKLGFNEALFSDLAMPGSLVGNLKDDIQKQVGGNIKVFLCSSHDTASAVEGIPNHDDIPYISSGTWSLLGIKEKNTITSSIACECNYSNEYGPNYIRFQKNIMGLWIIQGLAKQLNLDFPTMVKMAKESDYDKIFDVNDKSFLSSLDMKKAIKEWYMNNKISPAHYQGRIHRPDEDVFPASETLAQGDDAHGFSR